MATQNDLVRRVSDVLSLYGAGQAIPAEDDALIKSHYLSLRAELARQSVVDWNATDDIPDAALGGMSLLVANDVAELFGKEPTVDRETRGQERLRDYRETPYAPRPQMRSCYF